MKEVGRATNVCIWKNRTTNFETTIQQHIDNLPRMDMLPPYMLPNRLEPSQSQSDTPPMYILTIDPSP